MPGKIVPALEVCVLHGESRRALRGREVLASAPLRREESPGSIGCVAARIGGGGRQPLEQSRCVQLRGPRDACERW